MLIKGYSNKEEVVENQATEEVCSLNAVIILFVFLLLESMSYPYWCINYRGSCA